MPGLYNYFKSIDFDFYFSIEQSSGNLSAIIGGTVASFVVILLIIIGIIVWVRSKRKLVVKEVVHAVLDTNVNLYESIPMQNNNNMPDDIQPYAVFRPYDRVVVPHSLTHS